MKLKSYYLQYIEKIKTEYKDFKLDQIVKLRGRFGCKCCCKSTPLQIEDGREPSDLYKCWLSRSFL